MVVNKWSRKDLASYCMSMSVLENTFIRTKVKKLWKQVRGQKLGNESENRNRLNIELSVYYT